MCVIAVYVHLQILMQMPMIKRKYCWRIPIQLYFVMNLQFGFQDIFHVVQYISLRGVLIFVNEIYLFTLTKLSKRWNSFAIVSRMSWLIFGLLQVKTWGESNEVYVVPALWWVQFYIGFINNMHLLMSHSFMCAFLYFYQHHCCMLYYFLSLMFSLL